MGCLLLLLPDCAQIYHLRQDREYIESAQAASLSSKPVGLKVVTDYSARKSGSITSDTGVIPLIRGTGSSRGYFERE